MELPRHKPSVFCGPGLHFDQRSGSEIRPRELLRARPHYLHGLACSPRQPCSLNRSFSGMLAAVAAAHVRLDNANSRLGNLERLSKLLANTKWALRSRPDRQAAVIPFGYSSARFKWSMRNVLNRVARFDLHLCGSQSLLDRAILLRRPIVRFGVLLQVVKQVCV